MPVSFRSSVISALAWTVKVKVQDWPGGEHVGGQVGGLQFQLVIFGIQLNGIGIQHRVNGAVVGHGDGVFRPAAGGGET